MADETHPIVAIGLGGVLRSHPYGFIVTNAADGSPTARLVQHLSVDDDLAIWIATSPRSRKAEHIASHPAVAYCVEDRASVAYASVTGAAEVVSDRGARARLWQDGLQAFFPAGPDGDDFVLIRISTTRTGGSARRGGNVMLRVGAAYVGRFLVCR